RRALVAGRDLLLTTERADNRFLDVLGEILEANTELDKPLDRLLRPLKERRRHRLDAALVYLRRADGYTDIGARRERRGVRREAGEQLADARERLLRLTELFLQLLGFFCPGGQRHVDAELLDPLPERLLTLDKDAEDLGREL